MHNRKESVGFAIILISATLLILISTPLAGHSAELWATGCLMIVALGYGCYMYGRGQSESTTSKTDPDIEPYVPDTYLDQYPTNAIDPAYNLKQVRSTRPDADVPGETYRYRDKR